MRISDFALAPLLITGLAATASVQAAPVRTCESLTTLKLSHASIVSASSLKAGPTTMTTFLGQMTFDVPARCEVRGSAGHRRIQRSDSKCGCRWMAGMASTSKKATADSPAL